MPPWRLPPSREQSQNDFTQPRVRNAADPPAEETDTMLRRGFLLTAGATALAHSARAGARTVALELFTSQGCSSCPPADALLGELARLPGVVALAWHVDYWNDLGWRDPFATRFATQRQRAYATRLHDDVYTPGLVVNGATMVVGSDRPVVAAAIARAAPLAVPAALVRDAGGLVAMLGATEVPLTALLAVYAPERATPVGGGENDGRRLREFHIVLATHFAEVPPGASRALRFPAVVPGNGAALLLQQQDLRIVGAADLGPTISV